MKKIQFFNSFKNQFNFNCYTFHSNPNSNPNPNSNSNLKLTPNPFPKFSSILFSFSFFSLISAVPHFGFENPDTSIQFLSSNMSNSSTIMPTFFISHGGGPCFFMDDPNGLFKEMDKNSDARKWYENFAKNFVPEKPKSILVISAHWETSPISIITKNTPTLLYDYYGFPEDTYTLQYPCPHGTELVYRLKTLLKEANIPYLENNQRGLDHGVFIPLKLMYPNADIPVVQLSLHSNLNPDFHIKLGEALAPLRSEGVLIIGSGSATHNLSAIFSNSKSDWPKQFINWLNDALTNPDYELQKRKDILKSFKQLSFGRQAHPREEHFIPLFVTLGASNGKVTQIYDKLVDTLSLASWKFD